MMLLGPTRRTESRSTRRVPGAMDVATSAWVLSLLVLLVTLPMAMVRAYAYYSGARDHTRTMWIAMIVAAVAAAIAATAFFVLTLVLLLR
jgi:hypothetical protein